MIYVILSVVLGLGSWVVPFLKMRGKANDYRTILSFGLCFLSIYLQILLMKSYGDEWTLVVDAVGALTNAIPVLFIGTMIANILNRGRI